MTRQVDRKTAELVGRLEATYFIPAIYSLLVGILENLDDWERYAIMGDALEEAGELGFAVTFRWMGEKHRHPRWGQGLKKPWVWLSSAYRTATPWNLWATLPGSRDRRFASYAGAVTYLHCRLHAARSRVCISGDVGRHAGGYSDV